MLQYPCHGQHDLEKWVVSDGSNGTVRFAARHSGKGIEVKDGASGDGTPIAQKSWQATPAQEFKLVPAEPVAAAGAKAGDFQAREAGQGGQEGRRRQGGRSRRRADNSRASGEAEPAASALDSTTTRAGAFRTAPGCGS